MTLIIFPERLITTYKSIWALLAERQSRINIGTLVYSSRSIHFLQVLLRKLMTRDDKKKSRPDVDMSCNSLWLRIYRSYLYVW